MLEQVHFDEAKQSQLPALELLVALGYEYISTEEVMRQRDDDPSNFILKDIAQNKLMKINGYEVEGETYKFSSKEVYDAIDELENIQYEGLIDTSQKVFNMIMPTAGGKTIRVNANGKMVSKNFRFIDFEHPENNAFHVTAEYQASGKAPIRPDIVCFVNGIPFAVIENKKSSVEVMDAVHQMNRNQGPEYCPRLFTYTQLLVATNGKELLYGTTGTPNKFYATWLEKGSEIDSSDKEWRSKVEKQMNNKASALIAHKIDKETYAKILTDLNGYTIGHTQKTDRLPTEQDRSIMALFEPKRLLNLTKNYTLYDAGTKKLSRYQQYFAIQKMMQRIFETEKGPNGEDRRRGGLVWHTQGSGKSLTMVMFVKALIENPLITNPRVIVVTDRRDLDRQIRETFNNCNLKKDVVQTTSGKNLLKLIKEKNLAVITTLVQKFESASKQKVGFSDSDSDIFVLIDEAHRSQYGIANLEMNRIIPNACYIGFTGTPLMSNEKESWRKFGGYIDKYTIVDALGDKMILPLIYEGRYVDLQQDEKQIDRHISRLTDGMNVKQKKDLQKYVGTSIIKDNPQRIHEIAYDIENHYTEKFQNTGLKAQLVAPSKFSAVQFQKYFEDSGKIRTAVVISDEHDDGDVSDSHRRAVIAYLDSVRENHSSITKYEKDVINSFKYNEDGIEIVIVVDKLLTGFDAPRNTVLYLAKDLKDHNLLQAIARVNRLFENKKLPKTAGYIIDYSENAKNIDTAMKLFGNYDDEDVQGTLIDVDEKIEELERDYGILHEIFKEIQGSTDDEEFLQVLEDEPTRETFYKALNQFIRTLNECYVLQDFVHEFDQLDVFAHELKKFMELRKTASLKFADRIDLAEYKQSLVQILDKYVTADEVELLTKQINITDREQFEEAIEELGSDKSKAEAIAAQTDKTITEQYERDPDFYDRFSKKVSDILQKMREGKLADIQALKQLKLIRDDVINKQDKTLPDQISAIPGADIFYRNLNEEFDDFGLENQQYIETIKGLFSVIHEKAIVDWYKNIDVKRQIMNALDDYLYDTVKKENEINLSEKQMKEIINKSMLLAENNYEIFEE